MSSHSLISGDLSLCNHPGCRLHRLWKLKPISAATAPLCQWNEEVQGSPSTSTSAAATTSTLSMVERLRNYLHFILGVISSVRLLLLLCHSYALVWTQSKVQKNCRYVRHGYSKYFDTRRMSRKISESHQRQKSRTMNSFHSLTGVDSMRQVHLVFTLQTAYAMSLVLESSIEMPREPHTEECEVNGVWSTFGTGTTRGWSLFIADENGHIATKD